MTQDPNHPEGGQQPPQGGPQGPGEQPGNAPSPQDPVQQPPQAPAPGGQPPQGPPPETPAAPGVNGPGPAGPPTPPPGGYQGGHPGYGGPAAPAPGQAGVAGAAVEWVEVPTKGSVKLASIGQRFGARLLDIILVGIISAIIIGIGIAIFAGGAATTAEGIDPETGMLADGGAGAGLGLGTMLLSLFIAAIFAIAYEAIMVGVWGQTLGKMLLKIKVIKANTGQVPGIGGGIVRYIIPFFAQLIPFLGTIAYLLCYLWAAFDQRRQGWHDKVAGTYVVDCTASPQV